MTRVLLLCEYPTLNGGERSLLAVVPELIAAGFHLSALAPGEGPLAAALAAAGVDLLPLVTHDSNGARLSQAALREQIAAAAKSVNAQLLHANSLAMGRLAGPVARELKLPSLAHMRDIVGLSGQGVRDLNSNSRLLAVSHATRDFHIGQGIDPARTHVLYNGVDLNRFRPRPACGFLHAELDLPPGALLVGSIGQLVLRKGTDILIAAAATVAARLPHLHFLLVGARYSEKNEAFRFESELRQRCASGTLAGRVHFLGVRADVARILNELTLLAHPARQEPLGRVLLEAAASGVPIVATGVGGTREIFPPGAAHIVPAEEPAALAASIVELLEHPAQAAQQTAIAREFVRQQFNAHLSAIALASHYRAVLDASRGD